MRTSLLIIMLFVALSGCDLLDANSPPVEGKVLCPVDERPTYLYDVDPVTGDTVRITLGGYVPCDSVNYFRPEEQ